MPISSEITHTDGAADPVILNDQATIASAQVNSRSWRVRIFRACNSLLMRLVALVVTLQESFWLGIFNSSEFHELSRQSHIMDRTYADPDYNRSGFFPWEETAFKTYFKECFNFLVSGAGAGREIIALVKAGRQAAGFDCCEELVKVGTSLLESEGIHTSLIVSAPDRVPEELGIYDGLIVGWGSYSLIESRSARVEFLVRCTEHLKPGGPMLVSFLERSDDWRSRLVFTIAGQIRRMRMSAKPLEYGDRLFPGPFSCYFHEFSRVEIEKEFAAADLRIEFYCEHPYPHCVAKPTKSSVEN